MNTKKIKLTMITILVMFIFTSISFAQKQNCFEVKHLDFFGLDQVGDIKWSNEQIDQLLKIDYEKEFMNTRFYIPILVHFLKDFHPSCNKSIDNESFDKLVLLYFKVTLADSLPDENKSIEEKLNFIRKDFYRLVKIDKLLPLMKYTFDDGPLYGEIPKTVPTEKPLETIATDFGKLSIIKSNKKIFLIATDKENKTIWSRIVKGMNPDRFLASLEFGEKGQIWKTSLATIFQFYSQGERLTLYLKPDGKFMYYYHSW